LAAQFLGLARLTDGNEFSATPGGRLMNTLPIEGAGLLSIARTLQPPKRQNKHAPKVTAQHALFAMLNGEAVGFSQAEWMTIPGGISRQHLRRIRIRENRFVYGVKSSLASVDAVMRFLIRSGWREPAATCKPTIRGGGKNDR